MCCSVTHADFRGTRLYLGEAIHPTAGKVIVLGYENTAQNLAAQGGNAMILHFPAGREMGEENVVDTSKAPAILRDMEDAVRPRMRGMSDDMLSFDAPRGIRIFESGIYTVLMTSDPKKIPEALERVPLAKRPPLNPVLFDWYAEKFPGWQIAVCCFDNRQAVQATPMLWWYVPGMNDEWRVAPAVDSHDGTVPNLGGEVQTDHWLFLGSTERPTGNEVRYSDGLSPLLQALLPRKIIGKQFRSPMRNGDFLVPAEMLAGNRGTIERGLLPQ